MNNRNEIRQVDLDNLADIIWWIKGYMSGAEADSESCPFSMDHHESLRRSRIAMDIASVDLKSVERKNPQAWIVAK